MLVYILKSSIHMLAYILKNKTGKTINMLVYILKSSIHMLAYILKNKTGKTSNSRC